MVHCDYLPLFLQLFSEKISGIEGTKLDDEFLDMERVRGRFCVRCGPSLTFTLRGDRRMPCRQLGRGSRVPALRCGCWSPRARSFAHLRPALAMKMGYNHPFPSNGQNSEHSRDSQSWPTAKTATVVATLHLGWSERVCGMRPFAWVSIGVPRVAALSWIPGSRQLSNKPRILVLPQNQVCDTG